MGVMSESLSMLELAQQATAEELGSGLATATDDAASRAAESRSKTRGTAARLCRFLREQLPAAAKRFADAAERVMPAAAEAAVAAAAAANPIGVSSGAAAQLDAFAVETAGLSDWRDRLRMLTEDVADAIEAPAQLAL